VVGVHPLSQRGEELDLVGREAGEQLRVDLPEDGRQAGQQLSAPVGELDDDGAAVVGVALPAQQRPARWSAPG
jgi:hypothetical protein